MGFLNFPTYNRCTGKSKLVYVWIQESVKLPTLVIMLFMDLTGQKRSFNPCNILLVVKKMCRHVNKNLFHAELRQKICSIQRERRFLVFVCLFVWII